MTLTDIKNIDTTKVWYLAGPYSSPDFFVQVKRREVHRKVGSALLKAGVALIEPITTSAVHADIDGLPSGYTFWKKRDRLFVSVSHGLLVIPMPGWEESVGTVDEISYAKELGKPVLYLDFEAILRDV